MTHSCLPPDPSPQALTFALPGGAWDSHAHVFGPYAAYPLADDRSYTPPEQPVDRYLRHLDGLGFAHGVLVTASATGTDNRSVIDALLHAPGRLRGVIVPAADSSDEQLDQWTAAGVRGVRVNLLRKAGQPVYRNGIGLEQLQRLAPRLASRGWHVQVWIHAPDLPDMAPALLQLGMPLVIDHMGRMNTDLGVDQPGFQALCRMLADGRAWAKLSGADRISVNGPPFADADPFALALIEANPDQLVWGSDWPHINYFQPPVPNDGLLLNRLARWLPDPELRRRVLVDNPARLYA